MKWTVIFVLFTYWLILSSDGQLARYRKLWEMTPEEAAQEIASASTGKQAERLTAESFESQRLDLIKLCSESNSTWSQFRDAMKGAAVSPLKQKVIIMMLRSSPGGWHDERGSSIVEPFGARIFPGMGPEFYWAPIFKECFPGISIDANMLLLREKRLKLADDMESVVK